MRIVQEDTVALLIDVQEKLFPVINRGEEAVRAIVKLIKGLHILDVPIIPVRHYPQGLGDIVPDLQEVLGAYIPYDKTTFSAFEEATIVKQIESLKKKNLLVFGMEAHVCVLQTVIDFANNGYTVVMVADCVASRSAYDREVALRRAEQEGAILTTSESILFELQRKSATERFRKICALVK